MEDYALTAIWIINVKKNNARNAIRFLKDWISFQFIKEIVLIVMKTYNY